MNYAEIKGFNYQPSYGRNGLELWRNFDASTIRQELGQGKHHFPRMNAIRLWLSWDAFVYADDAGRRRFCDNVETALEIAEDLDLLVMPVLFNRWHNAFLDYGGIYIDHFFPETWGGAWAGRDFLARCQTYVEAVVAPHSGDERILAWDLCNEPFSYGNLHDEQVHPLRQAEYTWLEALYTQCKALGVQAPVTVGAHWGTPMELVNPISDILSIHPYWRHGDDKATYERHLDADVAFARKVGKPLLSTESCWGSLDDAKRVEIIRYTLGEHAKRGLGWLVYLLHHSLIADAHRPEYGRVGDPGNLAFIEADGSLRQGHGAFNEF